MHLNPNPEWFREVFFDLGVYEGMNSKSEKWLHTTRRHANHWEFAGCLGRWNGCQPHSGAVVGDSLSVVWHHNSSKTFGCCSGR